MSRIRNKPANASGGSSGLTMGLIALVAVAVAIGLGKKNSEKEYPSIKKK